MNSLEIYKTAIKTETEHLMYRAQLLSSHFNQNNPISAELYGDSYFFYSRDCLLYTSPSPRDRG